MPDGTCAQAPGTIIRLPYRYPAAVNTPTRRALSLASLLTVMLVITPAVPVFAGPPPGSSVDVKMPGIYLEGLATGTVELESWQFGVGRAVSGSGGAKRSTSTPNFSEIVLSRRSDAASTAIMALAAASSVSSLKIRHVLPSSGKEKAVMLVELTDVIISSYSVSAGGQAAPSESFSLNYSKIKVRYEVNGALQGKEWSYDITTNKAQ